MLIQGVDRVKAGEYNIHILMDAGQVRHTMLCPFVPDHKDAGVAVETFFHLIFKTIKILNFSMLTMNAHNINQIFYSLFFSSPSLLLSAQCR